MLPWSPFSGKTVSESVMGWRLSRPESKGIIRLAPFGQGAHDAVAEARAVVVAHLAEGHEIRLQAGNLVGDGLVATFYHRALLPDIPLEDGKLVLVLISVFGPERRCGQQEKANDRPYPATNLIYCHKANL